MLPTIFLYGDEPKVVKGAQILIPAELEQLQVLPAEEQAVSKPVVLSVGPCQ